MHTPSRVSVLLPTYNVAAYLSETLDSVLAQTRQPDEIILVDDCSSDNTLEIAQQYQAHFKELKIIALKENGGAAIARNEGLKIVTGDYIALQDGDDLWHHRHLEIVARLLDENESAAIASGRTRIFGDPNLDNGPAGHGDTSALDLTNFRNDGFLWDQNNDDTFVYDRPQDMFWLTAEQSPFPTISTVIRRSALDAIGNFNPNYRVAEDHEMYLRLTYNYPCITSRFVTSFWRRHPQSTTYASGCRWLCMSYRARYEFLTKNVQTMDKDKAARFSGILQRDFRENLVKLFYAGRWEEFDELVKARKYIPSGNKIALPWIFRRRLIFLQPLWLKAKKKLR